MAIVGANPTVITVTVVSTETPLPPGVNFAGIVAVVTDNSGVTLPSVMLTGQESPAWTATFAGAAGGKPATATLTATDTAGNAIGEGFTLTESGVGGISSGPFPLPTGGTLTVASVIPPASASHTASTQPSPSA